MSNLNHCCRIVIIFFPTPTIRTSEEIKKIITKKKSYIYYNDHSFEVPVGGDIARPIDQMSLIIIEVARLSHSPNTSAIVIVLLSTYALINVATYVHSMDTNAPCINYIHNNMLLCLPLYGKI